MRVKLRHKITATLVRPLFYIFARLRYNFVPQAFDYSRTKGPYLIVSNHCTDLDALFLALCFKEPIYFVANDHILRLGLISKIITYLCSPIPILKSASDIKTIRDIRTLVDDGGSIGLFPEGNRTYNGSTTHIPVVTGKLAKLLKIPIVIYNLEGGYLTSPRWSSSDRKGKLGYQFKRTVDYEEYRNMSPEQIRELLEVELRMVAPDQLAVHPEKYKGKNLAENLERLLYKCPICLAYETIATSGDAGSCSNCGLDFIMNDKGYLEGDRLPFRTILDWDLWQREDLNLRGLPKRQEGQPIFEDQGETLYEIERAKKTIKKGEGSLALYKDRLVFKSGSGLKIFLLSDIIDMVIYGRQNLQFTLTNSESYVLKNAKPRSAIKYVYHYNYLKNIKRGEVNGFLGF